jgi:3-oxoacyl-[acyl-carrier protein] reductase
VINPESPLQQPDPAGSRPVAFVTGSSRGIGLGIAEHLARQGFDLAINGVREEALVTEVLDRLRESGAEVIYCRGSIADASARADILDATEESFDQVLNTNLKGAYFLTQAAANWMIEQKRTNDAFSGSIITVSSVSATVASVNRGDYCISKAGLSMATQLFAVRLGEFGIPVYEVRPGIIKTDMTAGVGAKYDKLIADGLTVQPRWGVPDDVGRAVAAIAVGGFPYSTGQVFMVDGGMTLGRL